MLSARGIESVTSWTTRCAASAEPRAGTTTTSRAGSSTGGSIPFAHAGRQPGDGPALGLPVKGPQLGDGHDAGVDEVAEHASGTDRGQLRGIADEQQMRPVSTRLEQSFGEFDVEHGCLVDDDDVLVERRLGVAGEAAGEFHFATSSAALAGLGAEQTVDASTRASR